MRGLGPLAPVGSQQLTLPALLQQHLEAVVFGTANDQTRAQLAPPHALKAWIGELYPPRILPSHATAAAPGRLPRDVSAA
jgi:hypothetical protein